VLNTDVIPKIKLGIRFMDHPAYRPDSIADMT